MISIDKQIYKLSDLSSKAQTILGWLPEMQLWLNNALSDDASHFSFKSEAELLNEALYGLYNSHVFYLKNCDIWASPERYLAISQGDLSVINDVANGNKNKKTTSMYSQIISEEGILTADQLNEVHAFLQGLDIQESQIFSSLSLNDRIEIIHIAQQFRDKEYGSISIKAAVDFANGKCVDAASFWHIVEFALTLYADVNETDVSESALKNTTETGAITNIDLQTYYSNLLPYAMHYISCPKMGLPFSHEVVGKTINNWGSNAVLIGFTDLPTAMSQIARYIYANSSAERRELSDSIDNFNGDLFEFITQCQVIKHQLSQDASNWLYFAKSQLCTGTFVLAEDGCMSLKCFTKKTTKENENGNE